MSKWIDDDRLTEILIDIRKADARFTADGGDADDPKLSELFSALPWPEVDHEATERLADNYAMVLTDGTIIEWWGHKHSWVAIRPDGVVFR